MAEAGISESILANYLTLFAASEVFIFVFMEIVTKPDTIRRVILQKARRQDYVIFIVVFGLFSIFGTYVGIQGESGDIPSIRDLAPIVSGLVAGPYVGLAVGLIGAVHRLLLGGATAVACSLGTVVAGTLSGFVYLLNRRTLLGILPSLVFAACVEAVHGLFVLAIVRPFSQAVSVFRADIPSMIVAVSLGVGISMIILHSAIKARQPA